MWDNCTDIIIYQKHADINFPLIATEYVSSYQTHQDLLQIEMTA